MNSYEKNWEIVKEFDGGGQGRTYLANERIKGGRKCIIKVLNDNSDRKSRLRFNQEASTLELLNELEANVPQLLETNCRAGADDSLQLFIAMEFIPSGTLEDYVLEHVMSFDEAVLAIERVAKTIQIAHNEGVVHRDIKPKNILVKRKDPLDLVVIDWGCPVCC